MKFLCNVDGSDSVNKVSLPCEGASADMVEGAALIVGVTAGTNQGYMIIAPTTTVDVIGVLSAKFAGATTDSNPTTGVAYYQDVVINPFALWEIEYSTTASDLVACSSASSSTTFNMTSIEQVTGGWIYLASGTGAGQLRVITACTTNEMTTKTAFSPVTSTDTYFVKIVPQGHSVVTLIAAATKIGTAAAAGDETIRILTNKFMTDKHPYQELNPNKHNAINDGILDDLHPRFFAVGMFRNHAFNELS